jgi:FMN phosphatase YigB (HAD superfamily)
LHNFQVLLDKAASMGVTPDQHLHVAQSLFHDQVPAQQVGLHTVWINRYGAKRAAASSLGATPAAAPVTPHWEFATLRDFAEALLADEAGRDSR